MPISIIQIYDLFIIIHSRWGDMALMLTTFVPHRTEDRNRGFVCSTKKIVCSTVGRKILYLEKAVDKKKDKISKRKNLDAAEYLYLILQHRINVCFSFLL